MATVQTFDLVVLDLDVPVQEETCPLPATGQELFRMLNSRCEFAKWSEAHAWLDNTSFDIFYEFNPGDDQASATRALTRLRNVMVNYTGDWFRCLIELRKRMDDNTSSDGPDGPTYQIHPGIRGGRGPGMEQPGSYVMRPHGPDGHTLAEMRTLLQQTKHTMDGVQQYQKMI